MEVVSGSFSSEHTKKKNARETIENGSSVRLEI